MAEEGPVSVESRRSWRRGRDTAKTNKAVGSRTGYPKKSLSHFQPADKRMMYKFVKEQSVNHPVDLLCKTMKISRSAYYAFRKGETFSLTEERSVLLSEVKKVFSEHRRRYGSRRIKHALHRQGIPIGRDKVRRLMKSQNLVAMQPESMVQKTTDRRHSLGYSQTVLTQGGFPKGHDEAYVGDITYLPTTKGEWLYLMTWLDL